MTTPRLVVVSIVKRSPLRQLRVQVADSCQHGPLKRPRAETTGFGYSLVPARFSLFPDMSCSLCYLVLAVHSDSFIMIPTSIHA
jgi:hypothetical protein